MPLPTGPPVRDVVRLMPLLASAPSPDGKLGPRDSDARRDFAELFFALSVTRTWSFIALAPYPSQTRRRRDGQTCHRPATVQPPDRPPYKRTHTREDARGPTSVWDFRGRSSTSEDCETSVFRPSLHFRSRSHIAPLQSTALRGFAAAFNSIKHISGPINVPSLHSRKSRCGSGRCPLPRTAKSRPLFRWQIAYLSMKLCTHDGHAYLLHTQIFLICQLFQARRARTPLPWRA